MSPLANQDPLAQLNDIIGPNAASPWPPAPIYWLLLLAVLVAAIAGFYLLKRGKQQRKKQQIALTKLEELQSQDGNFIMVNRLLKGVALNYFPRQQVASLHGEAWFDFLHRYSSNTLFSGKEKFLQQLYKYSEQPCSPEQFTEVKIWIKQLPKQIKRHHKEVNKDV